VKKVGLMSHHILIFLEKVPGKWRKLKMWNFTMSGACGMSERSNCVIVEKQLAGHVACMRGVIVLLWRNLKEQHCWEGVYTDGRII
jgi:hypothetical protein